MRKKLIASGFLGFGFVAAVVWFYYGSVPGIGGGFSASDILAIRRVIRQETSEPILRIAGDGVGAAVVQTGRVGNGLDGSGHLYHLSLTTGGWRIVSRESWLSAWPNKPDATNPAIMSLLHAGRQRYSPANLCAVATRVL